MSRKESLQKRFRSLHGNRFATVREYYAHRRDRVRVIY
jgi:hypothetical protein